MKENETYANTSLHLSVAILVINSIILLIELFMLNQ